MRRRLYELLLLALPRGFREEFGGEMAHTFSTSGASLLVDGVDVIRLAVRLRVDQLRVDVRHAVRGLWRQKTFTLAAIATLALALGPATAVFSLFNSVLLDPLPQARDLDRIVYAWSANPERNRHGYPWSELNFLDHRERKTGLAHFGAVTGTSATIGGDVPRQMSGSWVSEDMFDVLGVYPARGRKFESADMQAGAAPTIILGDTFASTRFPNGDAVGQTLMVDGRATTVIGVLPRGFAFPADSDFWQPMIVDRTSSNRAQTYLHTMGRLRDGVTIADVEQQMNAVAVDLEKLYPDSNSGYRVEVQPAAAFLTRNVRRTVTVLGLAAIAILLLACTNVASLLVVRTAGRQDELAVRTALGASASRLSRQLLIEHLVLAFLAALLAVVVATGLLQLLGVSRLVPETQIQRASIGGMTAVFLSGLTLIIAVSLGWIVSRRATKAATLTSSQRSLSASRELVRVRQVLVSIEVGAAVVLLLAAGLLLQSAARLISIDPGFRTDNIITFQITLPMSGYMETPARVRFSESLVAELKRLPGVEAVASAAYSPMGSMRATRRFAIDGQPLPKPGTEPLAIDLPAGPEYASIMGLRVIDGRWVDERDRPDSPPVVVISESFARQHLPGQRAIGKRLRYFTSRPGQQLPMPEIVGVVSDVRQFGMAEAAAPQMYIPHAQRPWMFGSYFVRTAGDPRSVMASLPAAVKAVDPDRPLERLRTLDDLVRANTADRRALGALIALAAVIALLISAIGVYGVTAATTATRRRELAIRAAVGADHRRLMRLVIGQAMTAAVIGLGVGVAGGIAASSVLQSVLFEVQARDPLTYGVVGAGLIAVCWLATYLPARRALTISPAVALKEP